MIEYYINALGFLGCFFAINAAIVYALERFNRKQYKEDFGSEDIWGQALWQATTWASCFSFASALLLFIGATL